MFNSSVSGLTASRCTALIKWLVLIKLLLFEDTGFCSQNQMWPSVLSSVSFKPSDSGKDQFFSLGLILGLRVWCLIFLKEQQWQQQKKDFYLFLTVCEETDE